MVFTTTLASNIGAANKELISNRELISQVINYLSELAGATFDPKTWSIYTDLDYLYPCLLLDYVSISEDISGNSVYTFSFQILSYAGIQEEAQPEFNKLISKDLYKYFSSWNDQNGNEGSFNIINIEGTATFLVTYTI